MNKQAALEEARRVVGYIESEELSEADKQAIHDDSIRNFNENVNPGWLEYRITHQDAASEGVKAVGKKLYSAQNETAHFCQ